MISNFVFFVLFCYNRMEFVVVGVIVVGVNVFVFNVNRVGCVVERVGRNVDNVGVLVVK